MMNNCMKRVLPQLFKNNVHRLNRQIACTFARYQQENDKRNNKSFFEYGFSVVGTALGFSLGWKLLPDKVTEDDIPVESGGNRPGLPHYKMSDVAKHTTKESGGIWVTYREGVYDITKFIDQHPGGSIIMLAAGSALDPFWNLYRIHRTEHVLEMLETYRIGNLDKEDAKHSTPSDDPFAWEPQRLPFMIMRSEKPYCAEPPSPFLVENYITPQEFFFVRNHLPVPDVDPEAYELELCVDGSEPKTFTLDDLKKMPRHTVTSTFMCCGNRRAEMSKIKPIKGLSWDQGAIGNAEWTGVKLCDLLRSIGIREDAKADHVQFEGLDTDLTNNPYGSSIPLVRALDPRAEVLLVYEINGQPLSRDHGFPLRVIIPGVAGARNVKWLARIIVTNEESPSHWYQKDYKGFSPNVDWDTVDFSTAPAIQELPIISAICSPLHNTTVDLDVDDTITVKGYAWSGGGRDIIRVDLTCDDGRTWHTAKIRPKPNDLKRKVGDNVWVWSLWEAKIPIGNDAGDEVEIKVKAVDASYTTQPESFENIWNLRGVNCNAYHRVKVKIAK